MSIEDALQGTETTNRYIADAEQRDDRELAGFFRKTQDRNCKIAGQAKALLRDRLEV